LGAYLVGSANLWLSGIGGVGRSIVGALAGAIIAIEILKARAGIRGSTGLRFVAPLAAAIAVGRIGCFVEGLDDMTYGTPTTLPWGVDFGDGVRRHPVQLYESATMAVFLAVFIALIRRGNDAVLRSGFYLFVGIYAAQRFLWEFLKPYGTVVGPFNLFHLISIALIAYALLFARREAPRSCSTLVKSSP
jgi:prolipoprotein diacylglyceryltransferase